MKLYDNWIDILKKAWSVRFMLIAMVMTAAEVVVPMYADELPRNLFAILSGVSVAGAFIARLVAQRDV